MRGKSGGIQGTRTRVIRGVLLLLPSDARYESLFISLLRREDSVFFGARKLGSLCRQNFSFANGGMRKL